MTTRSTKRASSPPRRQAASAPALSSRPRGRRADSVERVYAALKDLAVRFELPLGGRLNEVDLARRLRVSRTPVREALNRLVSDGFTTFIPNRGFFARDITPERVRDLYEFRAAIEVAAVRLACGRAGATDIAEVAAAWTKVVMDEAPGWLDRIAAADEAFHVAIARLSGNAQIVMALEGLNEQVRYFRRVDQESADRRVKTHKEHAEILRCLARRDPARAAQVMEQHVTLSREHALTVTKEVIARVMLSRHAGPGDAGRAQAAEKPPRSKRATRRR